MSFYPAPAPLGYTMEGLLIQSCEIERDVAATDSWGGKTQADREVIATEPCLFWWWKEGGARSAAKEYAEPERTIELTGGNLMLARGANIKSFDHIKAVYDQEGNLLASGPFRVVSITEWEDHIEAALIRP